MRRRDLLPSALFRPEPGFQPLDGFRLRLKAAKVDSLLPAEQRDVIVRHAEFQGIAEKGDSVRRIRRDFLEAPENPMPFDREQGIRQAHVHQDARATVVDARQYYGLKKRSRLFGGFPVEQIGPQKTALHRELVFHSAKADPTRPSSSIFSPGPVGVSDLPNSRV